MHQGGLTACGNKRSLFAEACNHASLHIQRLKDTKKGFTLCICNMAVITDLTWQQLETASGLNNLILVDNTYGLTLRISALTTAAVNAKSQAGVVQVLYKLRELAALAQITANQNATIGERLAAFPQASTSTAVNGYVISNGQIVVKTPLQTTGILGANN